MPPHIRIASHACNILEGILGHKQPLQVTRMIHTHHSILEGILGVRVTQEQHTDIEYSKISTLNIAEDISFLWFFPQK